MFPPNKKRTAFGKSFIIILANHPTPSNFSWSPQRLHPSSDWTVLVHRSNRWCVATEEHPEIFCGSQRFLLQMAERQVDFRHRPHLLVLLSIVLVHLENGQRWIQCRWFHCDCLFLLDHVHGRFNALPGCQWSISTTHDGLWEIGRDLHFRLVSHPK